MPDDISRPLPETSLRLWFAMLAGPLAWSAHLLLAYGLVPIACDTGWTFLLVAVTVITALISLAGALISHRLPTDDAGAVSPTRSSDATDRMRFIASAGIISGIFFAAVILFEGLPIFFLDACSWGD